MTDYSKGQIYKVVDNGLNMCYIGSTVQPLSKRMSSHRRCYKSFLNGKGFRVSVYDIFEKYGVENCKITWIEDYACNSKKELEAREGEIQKTCDCVNKCIAGRDGIQYYQDTREKRLEWHKKHYEENKEYLLDKRKQHYYNNIEEAKKKKKEQYKKHKEQRCLCDCGATYTKYRKNRHEKTLKHQHFINQNNPQEPITDQS